MSVRLAIMLIALCIAPVVARQQVAAPSDFTRDERLAHKITARHSIIPLNELMKELTDATGVPLSTTRDISEDKVTIFVRQQPAREVMKHLASLLQCEWAHVRQQNGYRLVPKASALQMERALREAEVKAAQHHLVQHLTQWSQLAQRDYNHLMDVWEALKKAGGDINKVDLHALSVGQREVFNLLKQDTQLADAIGGMVSLERYLTVRIASQFTQEQWQHFLSGRPFVASTHPLPWQASLPEEVVKWSERMWCNIGHIQGLELMMKFSDGMDTVDTTVTRFGFEGGRRTFQGAATYQVWQNPYLQQPGANMANNPLIAYWRSWQTPIERLEAESALRTPLRRSNPQSIERRDSLTWEQRGITAAECLRWLAEHTDLNIIADAYRCGIDAGDFDKVGIPAHRWIREVLMPNGWVRVDGGWVRFRHKGYWQMRASEVPERLLRPLERKAQYLRRLDLDDYAHLAAQLTPLQAERIGISSMHRFVVGFDPLPLRGTIPALRFWNSLTAPQRERARRGERLLLHTLSPAQQSLFRHAYEYQRVRSHHFTETASHAPASFGWQVASREEYQAYDASHGFYSAKTYETLLKVLQSNQQSQEYLLLTRIRFQDITLRFQADGIGVTYTIPLRRVDRL